MMSVPSSSGKPPGKWIKGPEPHRMTLNRKKRATQALAKEATKCRTIEAHFIQQTKSIPSVMPPPIFTKKELISSAVKDLKSKINSKRERLMGQNLVRHQAVLGFLQLQLRDSEKNKG